MNRINKIDFVTQVAYSKRRHYIDEDNIKVVLSRLPTELWSRLKKVHFNDHAMSHNSYGYTTVRGRREISICALPYRVSLKWARGSGSNPEKFGAIKGGQWPSLAVRRYMLYYTFLHELGHFQIILPKSKNPNRKFASETKAHEFAKYWRKKLWATTFDHPDPVHNAPSLEEIKLLKAGWLESHHAYKKGHEQEQANEYERAISEYNKALGFYPNHTLALERLGILIFLKNKNRAESIKEAKKLLKTALFYDPLLPDANKYLIEIQGYIEKYDT